MHRYIKSDFDATLPNDMLYAPDGDANLLKNYYGYKRREEKERKEAEAKRAEQQAKIDKLKEKYPESKITELSEMTGSIDDILEATYDFLVPSEGMCDSVAGELVRAIMRVMYRDWNDGDIFYEGYGIETCLPSVAYIIEQFPDMYDDFDKIAREQLDEFDYTGKLEDIADAILSRIFYSDPELFFWAPNSTDSRDTDTDKYKDWEPRYQYNLDFTEELCDAYADGRLVRADIQYELEDLLSYDDIAYDSIYIYDYYAEIEGLDLDGFEFLENHESQIAESLAEALNLETDFDGDPDEDDEEDW